MMSPACHAIIPAAGSSRRMEPHHKLLLPWREGTIIDQILEAWTSSQVTNTLVVVRRSDVALQNACRKWSATVVLPETDPPDMKASIRCGLKFVAEAFRPADRDRWLVAPADLPGLSTSMINRLVDEAAGVEGIVVPTYGGRRGHPVSFPWTMASTVRDIPDGQGLNWLMDRHPVRCLDCPAQERPQDVDTPEDYNRLISDEWTQDGINGRPTTDERG